LALGVNAISWEEVEKLVLPPRIFTLRKLAVYYEGEMLAAKDAGSYFASCVMSAAMLEAFLLLLCHLKQEDVKHTSCYSKRFGNKTDLFDRMICIIGLEELVEISAELGWIPANVVDEQLQAALANAYLGVVAELRPKTSHKARADHRAALARHPAYSLMLILNLVRNRIHPGRWIREDHELRDENALSGWAHFAIIAAAHIRDCLIRQQNEAIIALYRSSFSARLVDRLKGAAGRSLD
jgi:hypothetical protein